MPYRPNRNTAKTPFVLLAMASLERLGEPREPLSLDQLRERMPRPAERAPSNQLNIVACSDCGRGWVPLTLHMQGGWLCALCHRELTVRLGYTDEYGRLLPADTDTEEYDDDYA